MKALSPEGAVWHFQVPLSEPFGDILGPASSLSPAVLLAIPGGPGRAQPGLRHQPCRTSVPAQLETHVPQRLIVIWDTSHASVSCQESIAVELLVFIAVKHNLTGRAREEPPWRAAEREGFAWVGGTFLEPSGEFLFLKNN